VIISKHGPFSNASFKEVTPVKIPIIAVNPCATNDGGVGMLQALGVSLKDKKIVIH
jgi:glycerate kinase